MYFSTHLLIGAAVGKVVGDPFLGGALGLLSHAAFDGVPHHDYYSVGLGLLDAAVGLTLFALALNGRGAPLVAGAVAGAFPDIEIVIKQALSKWPMLFPSHSGLTPHRRLKLPWGFATQAAIAAVALAVILL